MRTRIAAVAGLLAALAATPVPAGMDDLPGPGTATTVAMPGLPAGHEQRIGDRMAARLLGVVPPVADAAVQGYVNRVGRWVASVSERPHLDWSFAVLDTPAINGFAAPGGYVFVTRGLMLLMESEAELAAVLGHEIAHVTQRDHLEAIEDRRAADIAIDLLRRTTRGDASERELLRVADRAVRLYTTGFGQQDEYDADRIGAALAARAGYDPWGLTHTLTTLSALSPVSSAMQLHSANHPPPRARRDTLVNALGILLGSGEPGARPVERFRDIQDRLAGD